MYQTFLTNLMWYFLQAALSPLKKSAKKQLSQVLTIQRTVASRNVTQR